MLNALRAQSLSTRPLEVENVIFHPVIKLPQSVPVFDFSVSYDPARTLESPFGIGKYDELRPTMYTEVQFAKDVRNIHMGIDIAAPIDTPIHTAAEGEIFAMGINDLPQDYGPTIITSHDINGCRLFMLHGHLSTKSLSQWQVGDRFDSGAVLGWVGSFDENGGWNPHLHFQLSRVRPLTHDLPGVVSAADRQWARKAFPDPRLVLGDIY